MEVLVGADMEPETIVGLILKSKENWNVVNGFVTKVLSTKEKEEKLAQRMVKQVARDFSP